MATTKRLKGVKMTPSGIVLICTVQIQNIVNCSSKINRKKKKKK